MRTRRSPRTGNAMLRLGGRVILAALVVGPQTGCTREFFREWANQDVSEVYLREEPRPALAAGHLLDRAPGPVPVRGPL